MSFSTTRAVAGVFGLAVAIMLSVSGAEADVSDEPVSVPVHETVSRDITVQTLKPLGTLVGEWKGVGQPKRGSNAGAWTEKAAAAWRFSETASSLELTFEPGRQFRTASFSVVSSSQQARVVLTTADGDLIECIRATPQPDKSDDQTWIFESASDRLPQTRLTLRIISEIRITILSEERLTEKSTWRRQSELGLTRAGSKLADGNSGERQCVVTGGLGTIRVSHEGKTYYVCCEGCRQVFEDDPAGTLEAYRERLKKSGSN